MRRRGRHPRDESRHSLGLSAAIALALLASAAAAQGGDPRAAKEAVGLMIDNKVRISKLSDRIRYLLGRNRKSSYPGQNRESSGIAEDIDFYLGTEARTEVRAAWNSISITKDLLEGVYSDVPGNARLWLKEMFRAQESHYDLATGKHMLFTAGEYGDRVRDETSRFESALKSLPSALVPNAREREATVAKYREEIFSGGDDHAVESTVEMPITAKQYAKDKKAYDEWLANQERIERERRQRLAERREEQRKRQETTGEREIPKAGLSLPDDTETLADLEEMNAWHDDYAAAVVPVKKALAAFLEVQGTVRTEIMLRACQDLARATSSFLKADTAFSSPDPKVSKALGDAVKEFKTASDSCVLSQLRNMRHHLAEGKTALGRTAAALKPYALGL